VIAVRMMMNVMMRHVHLVGKAGQLSVRHVHSCYMLRRCQHHQLHICSRQCLEFWEAIPWQGLPRASDNVCFRRMRYLPPRLSIDTCRANSQGLQLCCLADADLPRVGM